MQLLIMVAFSASSAARPDSFWESRTKLSDPIGPTAADFPGRDSRIPASALPLRTHGRYIVDSSGDRVHLFCVNWYGAHMKQMVMNGLNHRALADIAADVVRLGFNCVRMPFSLDLVYQNVTQVPDASQSLAANPKLQHLSPLHVFDASVGALTDIGLLVILNNHIGSAGWCCDDFDGEGLWYTDAYPEDYFFNALALMANRYKGNPMVCGFDLRNEIRPSWYGFPTWGTGDSRTDWSLAATKGGLRVLAENKDMLIIVSGIFYGAFLCMVPKNPIHATIPEFQGRLVYTSHSYSWYNYHLLARYYVRYYFQTLCVVCGIIWLLCMVSWYFSRQFCRTCKHCCNGTHERCYLTCSGRCGMNAFPWLTRRASCPELIVAIACSVTFLAGTDMTSRLVYSCKPSGLMVVMGMVVVSIICSIVSLLLWLRIFFSIVFPLQRFHQFCDCLCKRCQRNNAGSERSSSSISLQPIPEEGTGAAWRGSGMSAPAESHRKCQIPTAAFASWLLSWHCLLPSVISICAIVLYRQVASYGTYETFSKELHFKWAFLLDGRSSATPSMHDLRTADALRAPVWLGEFGTAGHDLWWEHMVKFISELDIDWAYWPLNGEKRLNQSDIYGIFMRDMKTLQDPWKIVDLQLLMNASLDKLQLL